MKWINSALNCDVYSFKRVSSDHRIVTAKIHLSLRRNKKQSKSHVTTGPHIYREKERERERERYTHTTHTHTHTHTYIYIYVYIYIYIYISVTCGIMLFYQYVLTKFWGKCIVIFWCESNIFCSGGISFFFIIYFQILGRFYSFSLKRDSWKGNNEAAMYLGFLNWIHFN